MGFGGVVLNLLLHQDGYGVEGNEQRRPGGKPHFSPRAKNVIWIFLSGGVSRPGIHGATDDLGFHAVEHPHYVTDLHATVYQLLGLNPRLMEIPGRKRLDMDYGNVIREILS